MNNPIQNILNRQQNNQSMLEQFAEFKKTMQGKDPQAIVQNMLRNGQMTQAQFEQLAKQADALRSILK